MNSNSTPHFFSSHRAPLRAQSLRCSVGRLCGLQEVGLRASFFAPRAWTLIGALQSVLVLISILKSGFGRLFVSQRRGPEAREHADGKTGGQSVDDNGGKGSLIDSLIKIGEQIKEFLSDLGSSSLKPIPVRGSRPRGSRGHR